MSNPRWLVEMLPEVVDLRAEVGQREQRRQAAIIKARDQAV